MRKKIRGIRLEFKLQDAWIGAYWRKSGRMFEIWVCIIPCVPIHYWSVK